MISTKGRYALRTMIDIAQNAIEGPITIKEISKREGISIKYLERVISLMVKSNLLVSHRGNQGGYQLAKPSKEITAGDILRAAEGTLCPVSCLKDKKNECIRCNECSTLPFWEGFYGVINDYVNQVTLENLALKKNNVSVFMSN